MKAVVLTGYGTSDVLRMDDVPRPTPKPNEVLVRVHATTINDWDWCMMRGKPWAFRAFMGLTRPKVKILGAEIAGVVEASGPDVAPLKPGDRVYGDISEAGFSGFAEYVCIDAGALAPIPANMSFVQAASVPHAAMLAWQGLVDFGKIRSNQRVLINGAGGGVGTFGVQIAKEYGVEITGVDSAEKQDLMRSFGFDHTIDYKQHDFTDIGERYDLVLDTKTNRPIGNYARALTPGGSYVSVGGDASRLLELFTLGKIYGPATGKRFCIVPLQPNKDLEAVAKLHRAGGLRFAIDGPHAFEEIPRAMQRFGEGRHLGKIVILVRQE